MKIAPDYSHSFQKRPQCFIRMLLLRSRTNPTRKLIEMSIIQRFLLCSCPEENYPYQN